MRAAAAIIVILASACSFIGASEITITARNDSNVPMVVAIVSGDDEVHGEPQTVPPGAERQLTLAVPGGMWAVAVNGGTLMESSDAGDRRGALPVTVILSPPDEFPNGPYWESPVGWPANDQ